MRQSNRFLRVAATLAVLAAVVGVPTPVGAAPGPAIMSIEPTAHPADGVEFFMSVHGEGFTSGATVSFSGTGISTRGATVMGANLIDLSVTVAQGATVGVRDVFVDQTDGTGTCSGCFTVHALPAPASMTPMDVPQGGVVEVAIDGSGFQPGVSVHCGDGFCAGGSSTFVSASRFKIPIGADAGSTLGPRDIVVQNPDGGTGTCSACMNVVAGPHVASVDPPTITRGESSVLTVTGDSFQPGLQVSTDPNCCRRLTVDWAVRVSDTQVRVGVTVPEDVFAGGDAFFIQNPDGGRIGAGVYVAAPPVVIRSISPGVRDLRRGDAEHTFIVKGSGFAGTPGVGVTSDEGYDAATAIKTQVVRTAKDELRVTVDVPLGSKLGPRTVSVGNFDGTSAWCYGCATVVPQRYWMVARDGGVFAFGGAPYHGSMGGSRLNKPVVGMTSIPSGAGYWLVASDGGIFAFDAPFFGSMGGSPLNKPIVGMAATRSGNGYWLVASDGGMFAFGDAGFYGSMGGSPLNSPIVAMAPTTTGRGYWLVAADGGMFAFGDAGFYGSVVDKHVTRPVVGMAASQTGGGYRVALDDGTVYGFGDGFVAQSRPEAGRTGPIVAMAPNEAWWGYRLVAADGTEYGVDLDDSNGLRGVALLRPIVGASIQEDTA